ncbi:MAG TPA: alpha/beta fold hydrolase [Thermoanaerobaculia bacterium]|nr:alpha/beta fold hydrolase [Thermoanaerobaculia bacterium]
MIWALHGFLGRGEDWAAFRPLLSELSCAEPEFPDLFTVPTEKTAPEWGDEFSARVAGIDPSPSLIGYSMGGRLALHAMLARPWLFKRAVLISTGLGIEDPERRANRARSDERWAERFETEAWSEVIAAWNAQDVFAGSPPMAERRERDYNRAALGVALRFWSPAAHEPLAGRLNIIEAPVLLVAGARDARYVHEAERTAASLRNGDVWVVPGAGHRVPWERPESFKEALRDFFQQCRELPGAVGI